MAGERIAWVDAPHKTTVQPGEGGITRVVAWSRGSRVVRAARIRAVRA